ncbi:uncharacterized protein LOC120118212 [Hibiscus syriacus]|uniref:uncharacterized protein LOC120118212 n=1 Tax=Hibiscus syriacus TaxID=106335 RepID=UPI00192116CF|nr:uncharacterized protein LOC120118212 [Hibiscus syriacus]
MATARGLFSYHPKCKKIGLTHLSFADDLLIFCKANVESVIEVIYVLDHFYELSGLNLNSAKKLSEKDCDPLIASIKARLTIWSVKKLSYAERLELIRAVLFNIVNYSGARVSLTKIYQQKSEGGLGLNNLKIWNKACMIKLIKNILARGGSLWVAWINSYVIRDSNLWQLVGNANYSWGLNRILKLRTEVTISILNGALSIKDIWQEIRVKEEKVPRHSLIWFPQHVPKHSMLAWMTTLDRLSTRDRLQRMGITTDGSCVLCNEAMETRNHMFFEFSIVYFYGTKF